MVGSSSGAFIAAFAYCRVCPREALRLAWRLVLEHGILERPAGLLGVWGAIVRCWLEALLPPDAAERCNRGGLQVVATELPGLRVVTFTGFRSKQDLIQVLCASAHVPFVMDLTPAARYRGAALFDGTFRYLLQGCGSGLVPGHPVDLSRGTNGGKSAGGCAGANGGGPLLAGPHAGGAQVLVLDPRADGALRQSWRLVDCLRALTVEGASGIMARGSAYGATLGMEAVLPGLQQLG
ncbi:hypothetical protein GPECTOR_54g249 [Gonium pectorale]|uniref:Patatin n=1 Tax=Gonium pectorale TaxID=33097 RepID=A0A150G6N4_GONPE|nr:hypothetical protein GPECTOR_54g249 [Gonium pectorale]|eukprot:KXZ45507.1 hypothetical protein GPECTOR_54g249 [Gonium pectorale]